MNIFELDAASNNSVQDIRDLTDQVRFAPTSGEYKIYVIDEVHMLTNAAFNAFLKTLEEPPSYAKFILATTEKHKILPTILSRCQSFDFNRIQLSDIARHLAEVAEKEHIEAEPEALALIAQKADGGMRDALSIFDLMATYGRGKEITYQNVVRNMHVLDYDYFFKVVDGFLAEDIASCLITFDEVLKKGFEGSNFIVGLGEHLRNLMVVRDSATAQLLELSENVKKRFLEQAQRTPVAFLLSAMSICSTTDQQYKYSKNQRLSVELALMKICHLQTAIVLNESSFSEKKK
jgi:DNA polymerase-3 subunit gamma/tau